MKEQTAANAAWFMAGAAACILAVALVSFVMRSKHASQPVRNCVCTQTPDQPVNVPEAKPHWLEKET